MLIQSQIIYAKLKNELNNEIKNELQVVYILLQTRKLLETKNLKSSYPALNLYCNWVLHGQLDYPSTIKHFSNKFEPFVHNSDNCKEAGRKIIISQRHFFVLNELKAELSNFLKKNNLPDALTFRPHWPIFMKLLLKILMECPVKINGTEIDTLSLIEENDGRYCYRFHLSKKLQDNKNVIKIKLEIK